MVAHEKHAVREEGYTLTYTLSHTHLSFFLSTRSPACITEALAVNPTHTHTHTRPISTNALNTHHTQGGLGEDDGKDLEDLRQSRVEVSARCC